MKIKMMSFKGTELKEPIEATVIYEKNENGDDLKSSCIYRGNIIEKTDWDISSVIENLFRKLYSQFEDLFNYIPGQVNRNYSDAEWKYKLGTKFKFNDEKKIYMNDDLPIGFGNLQTIQKLVKSNTKGYDIANMINLPARYINTDSYEPEPDPSDEVWQWGRTMYKVKYFHTAIRVLCGYERQIQYEQGPFIITNLDNACIIAPCFEGEGSTAIAQTEAFNAGSVDCSKLENNQRT